ncbi:MAG TPA: tRNA-(ms[2]io[6]A)-hydroxylase [Flavobacteriales bacterium]|nr:tRNA-(ms[2]io[6]A)-hydroxylase [Flavobacteriales bacterium]
MKHSIDLKCETSPEWVKTVMADFDTFLLDHADCERKASAMAMSFIAKYPDRKEIIPELIETAVEELEHFQLVFDVMLKRGVDVGMEIEKDPYVRQLLKLSHSSGEKRFMDKLLIASVIECRGTERFKLIAEALEEGELKDFYKMLWTVEAKHGNVFVKMALEYFSNEEVYSRLEELMLEEAKIVENLELRAAVH